MSDAERLVKKWWKRFLNNPRVVAGLTAVVAISTVVGLGASALLGIGDDTDTLRRDVAALQANNDTLLEQNQNLVNHIAIPEALLVQHDVKVPERPATTPTPARRTTRGTTTTTRPSPPPPSPTTTVPGPPPQPPPPPPPPEPTARLCAGPLCITVPAP